MSKFIVLSVLNGAKSATSSMVTKLKDRFPLKYAVVRNDASISPMLIATNHDWSKVFFKNFLERIVQTNRMTSSGADQLHVKFTKFHSIMIFQNLTLFEEFNKYFDRLIRFYFEYIALQGFPKLANIFIMILCLRHLQTAVERGFRIKYFSIFHHVNCSASTRNNSFLHLAMLQKYGRTYRYQLIFILACEIWIRIIYITSPNLWLRYIPCSTWDLLCLRPLLVKPLKNDIKDVNSHPFKQHKRCTDTLKSYTSR